MNPADVHEAKPHLRSVPVPALALCRRARPYSFALSAGLLCFSFCAFANTNQVFVKTYPLAKGGEFALDNINGSVQVEGWDRDEVEVRAVKTSRADSADPSKVKIEVENRPSSVAVHTRYPADEDGAIAVEYHIRVPYRALLGNVGTVNGSVRVRHVEGGGRLRSVNGNVEVTESSGRFDAKTTNGDLRLELRHLRIGEERMNLETVNGSVVLGLPSDARADIEAQNMNGEFYSDVPATEVAAAQAAPGAHAFHGRFGQGGGEISVRTVNGGIRLLMERGGV